MGKTVSDLQTDIAFSGTSVTGTLKYVTGYTGFSGDTTDQSGNFIAFTASADSGSSISAKLIDTESSEWATDESNEFVFRITDKDNQSISVRATKGSITETKTYNLSGLTLESA